MNDHLKALKEKIIIRGKVEAVTALHIGSQRSLDPVESDAPVIKDLSGTPFIPGSSFKGVLRSFIEGILAGAELQEHQRPCFPTDNLSCIDEEEIEKIRTRVKEEKQDKNKVLPETKIAEYITEKACPVCRLFGSTYMAGKLKIKDMPVKEGWHPGFLRIRDGVVIDRDSRTARDRGKYDFETVSPGVSFALEIMGDNLKPAEKGMLLVALRLISQGYAALGGNVSRGTGRIKIDITEIEILDIKKFFRQYKQDRAKAGPEIITGPALAGYTAQMEEAFFNFFNPEVSHV